MIPTILDILVAAASFWYTAYTAVDYSAKTIMYMSILAIHEAPAAPLDSFPADLIFDLHFPCPPMITLIASAKEDHNKDRALPVEILSKIILMSHDISPISPSIMRVSRNCHAIAQPLVYDTIRLNRHTLPKLVFGLAPPKHMINGRYYISRRYAMKTVRDRVESRRRKLHSVQKATTLIIDDIPILFRTDFDDLLEEFCKYVVLPNVTKIIFCQEPNGPWNEDRLVERREQWDWGRIRERCHPYRTRASLFKKVLPAENKNVCVQTPPEGDFASIGNINVYNHDLPAHPVDWTFDGNKKHSIPTTELIMRYIEEFSGTVNLRIHQDVRVGRKLNQATIPATYVYRRFTPDLQFSNPLQVARSSGLTMSHHLAQFWQCDSKRARQDVYDIYYRLIHSIDKPLDNHLPLIGQIAGLHQYRVMESRSQKEAEKEFLMKVYQGVSALHPDSTTPCPCCKEVGVPL